MGDRQRFAFRLALCLGELDPVGMMERMDAIRPGLLDEWLEFHQSEPFGPQTSNLMQARIAAAAGGGSESEYLPRIG